MEKSELEKARAAYAAVVLEWWYQPQSETQEYILALERECDRLRSHPLSEELLMQVGNSSGESTTATVDENGFIRRKYLAKEPSALTPVPVDIKVELQPFFEASSHQGGEEFTGTNVEDSGGSRHVPPGDINSLQFLTSLIAQIELDLTNSFVHREKSITSAIDGTINRVISVVNEERISVVAQFAAILRSKISAL
jgi:hypothetical protein